MRDSKGVLATMWVGGDLDWLCRACLKSAVRQGHSVHFYSYFDVPNLPPGITHLDARQVIPETDIFRFDGVMTLRMIGSFAPFSDVFRYRMMGMDLGTWIDSDVYFVRLLDMSDEFLLCWEEPLARNPDEDRIGNAVMRVPARSPMLRDLVKMTSKPYRMPPWVGSDLKQKSLEKLDGQPFFPGAVSYATYGPNAVTYCAIKHRLRDKVRASALCYPVAWRDVARFKEADAAFRASLPDTTAAVHTWNSQFGVVFANVLPMGSFAARLREESLDG